MEKISIKILDNTQVRNATIEINGNLITFAYDDATIKENHVFPFGAIKNIREELEKKNIFLLINASRVDVYPSGMSWYSINAYKHRLGEMESSSDIVNILDTVDNISEIGTVDEQKKYFLKWVETIKQLP